MSEEIKTAVSKWLLGADAKSCAIYENSINRTNAGTVFAYHGEQHDYLIVSGDLLKQIKGECFDCENEVCVAAEFNHDTAVFLRKHFPFTAPVPVLSKDRTIGLGDRLGIATPAHIQAIKEYDVYPVFAQQSMRELSLTGRTYQNVLDNVTFAVFCWGYKKGFGADGDHLKTHGEVSDAVKAGFCMITLDLSEHIHSEVANMSDVQADAACELPFRLKDKYLNATFQLADEQVITIDETALKKAVLIYGDAIDFATKIYHEVIENAGRQIDFEISIDETETPTLPEHHYFIARELMERRVNMQTIAPKFCGEFQKGIDYIGDIERFECELKAHVAIAEHFSYKLSIHSGSDKFSLFPSIGQYTKGKFHLKTAGTSWLESMKLVAMKDPQLFREIYDFAKLNFNDAKKLYHISASLADVPDIDRLKDDELPDLFSNDVCRQLIHITYGHILTDDTQRAGERFADKLFDLWRKHDSEYIELLKTHIKRHVELLCKTN